MAWTYRSITLRLHCTSVGFERPMWSPICPQAICSAARCLIGDCVPLLPPMTNALPLPACSSSVCRCRYSASWQCLDDRPQGVRRPDDDFAAKYFATIFSGQSGAQLRPPTYREFRALSHLRRAAPASCLEAVSNLRRRCSPISSAGHSGSSIRVIQLSASSIDCVAE